MALTKSKQEKLEVVVSLAELELGLTVQEVTGRKGMHVGQIPNLEPGDATEGNLFQTLASVSQDSAERSREN
jgi:hypothetical protein